MKARDSSIGGYLSYLTTINPTKNTQFNIQTQAPIDGRLLGMKDNSQENNTPNHIQAA